VDREISHLVMSQQDPSQKGYECSCVGINMSEEPDAMSVAHVRKLHQRSSPEAPVLEMPVRLKAVSDPVPRPWRILFLGEPHL
jgi:hypothetical protein